MITALEFFHKLHGNEHWLVRPSIIEFAEKYHQEKLKEEVTITYTQNYEEKRKRKIKNENY